jgi:hypothetical protein
MQHLNRFTLHDNNVWNKLNPWSDYEQSLDILDSYSLEALLLEMNSNYPESQQTAATVKRQAIAEMKSKLETAIEIIDQLASVVEIYLAEENTPQDDDPSLYMVDEYGFASMHIKKFPYSSDGNALVSYRGYLKMVEDDRTMPEIPLWRDLPDYFVKGEIV